MTEFTLRAASDADIQTARALVQLEVARHPYAQRTLELLDIVRAEGEYRALVADRDGTAVGIAVYGLVAGTDGAGALYAVAVDPAHRRRGIGRALVRGAAESLSAIGARFVLAELPDDPAALGGVVELFAAGGFAETARVPDLYRDGVALTFWRRGPV